MPAQETAFAFIEWLQSVWGLVLVVGAVGSFWGGARLLVGFLRNTKSYLARRRWIKEHLPTLLVFVPGRRKAHNLEQLVRVLGRAQYSVSGTDCELAAKIRHDLIHVLWNIWTEALAYAVLFSNKEEKQCLALRNLSQIDDETARASVHAVVKGVLEYPLTSPRVKEVARAVLEELEKRREIDLTSRPTGLPTPSIKRRK